MVAILDSQRSRAHKLEASIDRQGQDAGQGVVGRERRILVDTLGSLLNVLGSLLHVFVHPAGVQDRNSAPLRSICEMALITHRSSPPCAP